MTDAPYQPTPIERTPLGAFASLALPPPGAEVPDEVLAELHEGERAHAATLGRRRAEWVGGRLALRRAAAHLGLALPAVLVGEKREPLLPPGVTGSIAHKAGRAIALCAPSASGTVGVDLERLVAPRAAIEESVLTAAERAALPADGPARIEALLGRFAAKEAIYKALFPRVRRWVGFEEAEVTLTPPSVTLRLARGEGPFEVELLWRCEGEFVVAAVRLREATG